MKNVCHINGCSVKRHTTIPVPLFKFYCYSCCIESVHFYLSHCTVCLSTFSSGIDIVDFCCCTLIPYIIRLLLFSNSSCFVKCILMLQSHVNLSVTSLMEVQCKYVCT